MRRFEQLRALERGPITKTVVCDFIFEKDKLFACLNLTDQNSVLQPLLQLLSRPIADARSGDLPAGHS